MLRKDGRRFRSLRYADLILAMSSTSDGEPDAWKCASPVQGGEAGR
jgi:hypothetical protein